MRDVAIIIIIIYSYFPGWLGGHGVLMLTTFKLNKFTYFTTTQDMKFGYFFTLPFASSSFGLFGTFGIFLPWGQLFPIHDPF
mmetsp:Transcript_21302/g.36314  ORF Transcript_21302/g.36314 Transcript_21302/m.36314 type:complete len:82 (+) Transcript_21302:3-248(+)